LGIATNFADFVHGGSMMDTDCRHLFAYGTLRRGCDNSAARLVAAETCFVAPAMALGYLYQLDGYPGFVADPAGGPVAGDLLEMRDPAALLALLDAYEECSPDFPEPHEYRRLCVPVSTAAGTRRAWTYVYAWPTDGLPLIVGGDSLR
jgi:gamma-glutamylcyclotransferase (GGCT)/AIG2-like uncharacterized protein YtfP